MKAKDTVPDETTPGESQTITITLKPGEVVTAVIGEDHKAQQRRYTREDNKLGFPLDADGQTIHSSTRGGHWHGGPIPKDPSGRPYQPAPATAYGPDGELLPVWVRNANGTITGPGGTFYGRHGRTVNGVYREHGHEDFEGSVAAVEGRVSAIETALVAAGIPIANLPVNPAVPA